MLALTVALATGSERRSVLAITVALAAVIERRNGKESVEDEDLGSATTW